MKKQGFRLGYNFIFGKSRKQVRHGKAKKRHSELAASLVCEEGAIQGRGPFRVVRNRRIWVNKLRFCRRKRDFRVFATLNQVQGDENRAVIPNLFGNRRIEANKPKSCRRKRDFQVLATLWKTRHFSQNQRFWKKQSNKFRVTKWALRHSELVSESPD